jgi:hypothetical protein
MRLLSIYLSVCLSVRLSVCCCCPDRFDCEGFDRTPLLLCTPTYPNTYTLPPTTTDPINPSNPPPNTDRMMGGAAPNWEENERFFRLHGLGPAARPGSDKALDLGCGCARR